MATHVKQLVAQLGRKIRLASPWLILFFLLLLPLYIAAAIVFLKSDLLNPNEKSISNEQYKALLAFVASGLGVGATIVGLLFTRTHNLRTLTLQRESEARREALDREASARLQLDTVVRVLDLVTHEGGYAPKGRVAGALATLIQLGYPAIAVRVFYSAWEEGAIDDSSAAWLIDEVYAAGSDNAKIEASALLRLHAASLTGAVASRGFFAFPLNLYNRWITDLPVAARRNNLFALVNLMLSRDRNWFTTPERLFGRLFREAMSTDPDSGIRATAAAILDALQYGSTDSNRAIISNYAESAEAHPSLNDYIPQLRQWRL